MVRRITERLLLRHTARAPVVVLGSIHDISYFVRSNSRVNRDRLFSHKSTFKFSRLVLYNSNSFVIMKARMEMLLGKVCISLTN